MVRELDDAILHMRTNELDIGTWLLKTAGDAQAALASDATLLRSQRPLVRRETIGHLRRTLARLDVSSRSIVCRGGRRLLLCGHLGRVGLLRRPHLHVGLAR
jgi:hypothetical protein